MNLLLFDLDGTLTDPAPGIAACIRHAVSAMGASPPEGKMDRFIGSPLRASFREILETEDSSVVEEAMGFYRERFAGVGLFENSVYPGIIDALSQLRGSGYELRVATSKPTVYADRIIDHFELRSFFPVVYGSELSGELSDKADLLGHVLDSEMVAASATCMIGDRKYDMVGAKVNDVTSVGVLWGYGSRAELEEAGACHLVDEIPMLASLIRGLPITR